MSAKPLKPGPAIHAAALDPQTARCVREMEAVISDIKAGVAVMVRAADQTAAVQNQPGALQRVLEVAVIYMPRRA